MICGAFIAITRKFYLICLSMQGSSLANVNLGHL
jgi:hypothetical protein